MPDVDNDPLSDEDRSAIDRAMRDDPHSARVLDEALEEIERSPQAERARRNVANGITPGRFGGMTPSEAAHKSAEVRRNNALERVRDHILGTAVARLKVRNAPTRDELKGVAAAVIFQEATKILADPNYVRNAHQSARVIEVFFTILRLESNQSTANVEHLTAEEKIAMVKELRETIAERAGALPAYNTQK